jgi:hypothetical protein
MSWFTTMVMPRACGARLHLRDTSRLAEASELGVLGVWALRELEGAGLGRGHVIIT